MVPDIGRTLEELPTPALLLDVEALERNLRRMADRTERLAVSLRPHIKTHKCLQVAERQRALGARGITVSTLHEARTFAMNGFTDITWAYPLVLTRVEEAVRLAGEVSLGLTVDSPEAVEALERTGRPSRVWLKVDSGYGRAGVDPASPAALRLAAEIHASPTMTLAGILSHAGHTYRGESPAAVAAAAEEERAVMAGFGERLRGEGIGVPEVSVGSTPGMARVRSLEGITEVRPGNYVFHDWTQVALGTCPVEDCALTVLASVVSRRPGADRCVIDAGALALSKDTGPAGGPLSYGRVFEGAAGGALREDVRVVSLSQEHGILDRPFPVGARVRILPNHSCLTAACFDAFHVVRGGEVVDVWKVWRGR